MIGRFVAQDCQPELHELESHLVLISFKSNYANTICQLWLWPATVFWELFSSPDALESSLPQENFDGYLVLGHSSHSERRAELLGYLALYPVTNISANGHFASAFTASRRLVL